MAITTHAELLTAIANYTARDALTAVDDDFVLMCEARLNYGSEDANFASPPLRVRQMEERSTATITGEYLALPLDFLQFKSIRITSTSPPRPLIAMTPANFDTILNGAQTGDAPYFFEIVSGELRFHPIATSGTVEMIYYEYIPPLATNDPNWLLTVNPNIYLYGCLLEAAIYIQEENDIIKYGRLFGAMVQSMNDAGRDSSQSGPLVARSDVNPARRYYSRA